MYILLQDIPPIDQEDKIEISVAHDYPLVLKYDSDARLEGTTTVAPTTEPTPPTTTTTTTTAATTTVVVPDLDTIDPFGPPPEEEEDTEQV